MVAKSNSRGHKIMYIDDQWIYEDNEQPLSDYRSCAHCGQIPVKIDDFEVDACISDIVKNLYDHQETKTELSCCGHGLQDGCILLEDGRKIMIPKRN